VSIARATGNDANPFAALLAFDCIVAAARLRDRLSDTSVLAGGRLVLTIQPMRHCEKLRPEANIMPFPWACRFGILVRRRKLTAKSA
jgi:hypothetical protein